MAAAADAPPSPDGGGDDSSLDQLIAALHISDNVVANEEERLRHWLQGNLPNAPEASRRLFARLVRRARSFKCGKCPFEFRTVRDLILHAKRKGHGYHEELKETINEIITLAEAENEPGQQSYATLFDVIQDGALPEHIHRSAENAIIARALLFSTKEGWRGLHEWRGQRE